jgi:hypothetical protein
MLLGAYRKLSLGLVCAEIHLIDVLKQVFRILGVVVIAILRVLSHAHGFNYAGRPLCAD